MEACIWMALAATFGTWLVTALGAATVVFFSSPKEKTLNLMLGFSAGVMIAASFWSLLEPAIAQAERLPGLPAWLVATAGFLIGALFLWGSDKLVSRALGQVEVGGKKRVILLVLSITLHNIPEGMAVGLAFALASVHGGLAAAAVLALGIGVQNLPEGLAVALPFHAGGMSRGKSFALGALSGVVEPIFGMLAALAMGVMRGALPGMMAFCAGAMMQVVFAEMIPQAAKTRAGVVCLMVGYTLMMALDLALG